MHRFGERVSTKGYRLDEIFAASLARRARICSANLQIVPATTRLKNSDKLSLANEISEFFSLPRNPPCRKSSLATINYHVIFRHAICHTRQSIYDN